MTISSSLLQLTGRMLCKKVAESDNSSLSYILNYFTTHRTMITSRYNERVIESYLEKLREVRAAVAMIGNKSNQRFMIEVRESRATRVKI